MNCRSEVLEISVEGRQIEEAMLAVLHTILLHRSTGKFHYKKEGTYSIGTVGTQDVDCDFIDFTYVRVSSEELDRALRKAVGEFKDALRSSGNDGMGQISLEFYQKKKSRWPFSDECIPWEVWTVKVNVVNLANEQERQICREKGCEMSSPTSTRFLTRSLTHLGRLSLPPCDASSRTLWHSDVHETPDTLI
ncbi:autophagy-related protein 101 isoform X2 [Pogona vitticeps]